MTLATDIPARLDRLPWSRFHTLVVVALGITWILDGIEVTLAGAVAGALKTSPVLHLSNADIGLAASAYLAGAVCGALFFGWLTDRLGRRRLFFVTLFLYIAATAATAFSWDLASFAFFRFLTGAGIGGEYTAINATIQELTPARVRGRTDLAINGSFWIGAALGAGGSIVLLDPTLLGPDLGWRVCFGIGAVLGLAIIWMRVWIPESPRWLMLRGRLDEAEAIVADIERKVGVGPPSEPLKTLRLTPRDHTPLKAIVDALFRTYRRRSLVGLALMAAQAFFYNAIFFTYALVLTDFYGVASDHVGWYILPFAIGNVAGPLLLGPLFDSIGRRTMIAATYAISGVLLADQRLAVRAGRVRRDHADDRVERDLLLRVGRGELGLSHRQRDLPARDPRARDRGVLRDRHGARRHRRAAGVRRADRHRVAFTGVPGLPAGRGADGRRGCGAGDLGGRVGAPRARGRGHATRHGRARSMTVSRAGESRGTAS